MVRLRIAIIGGGYSGSAVAINILRWTLDEISLTLVERAHTVGEGAAYGTKHREHVLNVPAGKMSALPDVPDHLLKWLDQHANEVGLEEESRTPKSYIPREVYSRYLKSTLQCEAVHSSKVDFREIHDEAVAASMLDNKAVEVIFASGNRLEADKVVLCLGNEKSLWPCSIDKAPKDRLIGNPWAIEPSRVPEDASVLIVGTGLSMADVVVSLARNSHKGKVTAISRRGIIPKPHNPDLEALNFEFDEKKRSALELSLELMERVAHHTSLGRDWREAFDGLRPHTIKLWRTMSPEDQQIAVKKGKAVWDVHRHRVAPEIHDALTQYFMDGEAEVVSAHLVGLRTNKDGKVQTKLDLGKAQEEREFDFVVNCTGPNNWPFLWKSHLMGFKKRRPADLILFAAVLKSSNALMQDLLAKKLVQPGSSGLGIKVALSSRVIGAKGENPLIWVVGPQVMDRDFESIAVPELREQALFVAKAVIG